MIWDWEHFRFWLSWPSRLRVRGERSNMSSSPSPLPPSSVSRFTSQPPSLWQALWRAMLVAAGLLYATSSVVAEWNYAMAWNDSLPGSERASHATLAAGVFPLAPRIRMAPAQLYSQVRWKGSREQAIVVLRAALADNPYAVDFRRNLGGFLIENGEDAAAEVELQTVARLSPRSRIMLRVNTNPETGGALRP